VDLGRDETGRRARRFFTVRGTRRDAERELARVLHEAHSGTLAAPSRMTVAQAVERWLEDVARPRVSGKTWERYAELARLHILPTLGGVRLQSLKPLQLQRLYVDLGRKGLSQRTVLHVHRLLHTVLQWAVRAGLVGVNICDRVEAPRPVSAEVRILTPEEAASLLRAASGTDLYLPVVLALACGLRRGEILALKWEDVDLERDVLLVRRSLEQTNQGLRFKEVKAGRGRAVALPVVAAEALRRQRVEQAARRLRLGHLWRDLGLVVCGPDGGPVVPSSLSARFARLARRAGISPLRFHDLRHTHASQLLRAGVDLKTVSARLGHRTAVMTLDVYGHVLPGAQEEAARVVDEILGTREHGADRLH
jgi:integrase